MKLEWDIKDEKTVDPDMLDTILNQCFHFGLVKVVETSDESWQRFLDALGGAIDVLEDEIIWRLTATPAGGPGTC